MRRALFFLCLMAACGDSTDQKPPPPEPPPFDDKSDALRRVDFRGVLDDKITGRGVFKEDLEFHGWAFDVHEAGDVTLAVTHAGTAASLDTTLFLFGPLLGRNFGNEALAWDDDSGWSRLSRLTVRLEPGRYLGVVGTASGNGRGRYQTGLVCAAEVCGPPAAIDGCPPTVEDWITTCVDDVMVELWVTETVAWDQCSSELSEFSTRLDLCRPTPFRSPAPWCGGYYGTVWDCAEAWDARLFPESAVAVSEVSVPAALVEIEQKGEVACAGECSVGIYAFKYASDEPATPTGSVGAIVRDHFDADIGWQNEGEAPHAELDERMSALGMAGLTPAASERTGSDVFHVGRARYSRRPPPFLPSADELWVLTFPEAHWIVAVQVVNR